MSSLEQKLVWFIVQISLGFVPGSLIDIKPALIRVMAKYARIMTKIYSGDG